MSKRKNMENENYLLKTYAKKQSLFTHGKNATLFSSDEEEYIDFTSGIGVVSVGHGNKRLSRALSEQSEKLLHLSNLYLNPLQASLAKKISALAGFDLGVFFANSGAEANEGAIKLARKYGNKAKKRYKIITLENSFHGRTLSTLKATGQESFHAQDFAPFVDGFCFVKDIDAMIKACDERTVAYMIELVQGEGGVNPLSKEKVQELARFCAKHDILLIVDEVQTGVFRTGEFLCSQVYGIEPDIITLAKGLGGGVPIGAVLTKHKDIFSPGDHGSTFGGGFLVSCAGLEVLDILEDLQKSGALDESIEYFHRKLKELASEFEFFQSIQGVGLMQGIKCSSSIEVGDLVNKAHENKLLVLKAGLNTLRFLPPLSITKEEIDEGFKRLRKACYEII